MQEDSVDENSIMEPEKVPNIVRCDCNVLRKIKEVYSTSSWSIDELVRVPSSAQGYIDQQSGKQVGSFMTYIINFSNGTVRRRYSDFEFLKCHFDKTYPLSIIPPIPEKQSLNISLTSVFTGSSKEVKSEVSSLVDYRVRAFQSFLCNVFIHPRLHSDHALHLFLTNPDSSWKLEVLQNQPSSPRDNKGPHVYKRTDKDLDDIMAVIVEFEDQCKVLEISQRSVLKRMQEILMTTEQLGSSFNGFSLECAQLSETLEKIGDVHDSNADLYTDAVFAQQRICESIHEITLFIASIATAIKNYSAKKVAHDRLNEQANLIRSSILQSSNPASPRIGAAAADETENSEAQLAEELAEAKTSLMHQLSSWLERLRNNWHSLILSISSAEKSFAHQGITHWQNLINSSGIELNTR